MHPNLSYDPNWNFGITIEKMYASTPTNEANLSFKLFAYFPTLKFRTISKMCVPDQTLNMLIQLPSGCDTYALSSIAESFYVDLDDNPPAL